MNPPILGVIGPGFLSQVPTLYTLNPKTCILNINTPLKPKLSVGSWLWDLRVGSYRLGILRRGGLGLEFRAKGAGL